MPSRVLTKQFQKTQARTRRAILIAAFSILAVGSISAWQLHRLGGDADSALASYDAIQTIGELSEALLSAESGQRGFLLTDERSYLVDYSAGVRAIPELIEQMRERLAPYVDGDREAALEAALSLKVREMAEVLELYERGYPGEAFSSVQTNTGKVVMDNLREALDLVRDAEAERLALRYADFRRTRNLGLLSILSVGVFAILFTVFVLRGQHAASQRLLAAVNIIQRQKGYLEAMLSSVSAPLILMDLDGYIRFVNAASVQLLNEPEEKLIGRPLRDFVQFRGSSEDETIFGRAISQRRVLRERRVGIQTPSGPQVIGLTVRPVEAEGGMPIGCMITLRDVEEEEATLEELHQQDRLRNLEVTLGRIVAETVSARAVLERCSEAIRQTSDAEDVQVWLGDPSNPKAILEPLSGPSGDRAKGPSVLVQRVWKAAAPEEERSADRNHFVFPLSNDTDVLGVIDVRTRTPLHARIVTDLPRLSSRISIGYNRRKKAEEIAQLALEKDRFIATLSHELRGPLIPLRYAVSEIASTKDSPTDPKLLGLLSRQVEQLERLVEDLLDVQRLQRGTLSLRLAPLDLDAVLDQSVEAARPLFERKEQRLEVKVLERGLPVLGDRARLVQVLLNLLNNASRYSAPRSTIRLSARRFGAHAKLEVIDEGIGIAEENLERVFHLFEQGSTGGDADGLGIGLALVRQLIELHGGQVYVSSPGVGRGATFSLTIPLAEESPSTAPDSMPVGHRVLPHRSAMFDRCVVVDDDVDTAETLALMLKSFGLRADVAHEANGALEVIQRVDPELILLDLSLPGQERYSLIAKLRSEVRSGIRIVAVTGHADDAVRREALARGFDDLLVKPITSDQLVAAACRFPRA